jgi:2-iminobutanoate/2-iminopropanoate deaminase
MNADLETETFQVMNNLKSILKEAGIDFNQVIKSSIFLKDMNDFAQVNTIYASFFDGYYPARETVEVSCLPRNVRVEISMIAELK